MMKKILVGVVVAMVAVLGYAAMMPGEYSVSREVRIEASAFTIFPYLNDSQKMNEWSPWSKMDPSAKFSFSGPTEGVGSKMEWDGGKQLGKGSSVIVESDEIERVKFKLEYLEPFRMSQDAEFSIRQDGDAHVVQWTVQGKNGFIARFFGIFMDMEKSVGEVFEKGLADLKLRVESSRD
jgi:uncharacterized protein YndB with AHSA1/START domain